MTKTLALAVLCLSTFAYFPAESLGSELPPSCSPNCHDVNASIQLDQSDGKWFSRISWSEVLANADCALPIKYELRGPFDNPLQSGSSDDPGSEVYIVIEDPCALLGKKVTLWISNGLGSSASNLTFKSGAPQFESNRFFLRCDDRAVEDVQHYLDEFYGGYKPVYVPCESGTVAATFVADWTIPFDCVPGSDTSKIILREFEATTKDGERRSAVDTVIVLRMPELNADNIYCTESDTVYCGFGSAGPYWLVPDIDPISGLAGPDCDQIFLLSILSTGGSTNRSLLFRPRTFDSKCGVLVHVDQQRFNDACNPQYKVDIELKQSCFGSVDEVCMVEPAADGPGTPNAFESIGQGYWRCSFWVTDFDTLAPVARCIYDLGPADRLIEPSCSGEDQVHCYTTPATEGSVTCGETQPVIIVPSGSHDCGTRVQLPAICVKDDWSGIKQVKVSIDGIGTWLMTDEGSCSEIAGGSRFELNDPVDLQIRADGQPHQVKYEVVDACHNTKVWYCYILIKDETKPVAVADKGVNVTLPGGSTVTLEGSKKVWVDAEVFDEGSWDNCGINLLLARRTDWYTACIDLCDSVDWCCVGEHHDTLWQAKLNPDKTLDPVEAHYAKTLDWLASDGGACTQLVYNAWLYDLLKWTTLQCRSSPGFTAQEFRKIFESCFLDYDLDCTIENVYNPASFAQADLDLSAKFHPTSLHPSLGCMMPGNASCGSQLSESQIADLYQHIDVYEQIGGGWSDAVPFDCSDACGPVTVEILVMDYWCNWSKAWTDVWVEDKAPITIEKDVVDGQVYCATYKSARYAYPGEIHPVSLAYIVEQAEAGDQVAVGLLDEIFGTYKKVWIDAYGNYVDDAGNEVDCEIPFSDSTCACDSEDVPMRVYDEHLGYQWIDVTVDTCFFQAEEEEFTKGLIAVNCVENVFCDQEIWSEFDHCGEGYIFRKFKIWQGCPDSPHVPDTLFRFQKIFVGNECDLEKGMFDLPYDTTVFACGITYDPEGSGNVVGEAAPQMTGAPVYRFDDDCRIVGIAHQDKVFKILGGDAACYKIIRTWYLADWCTTGGEPSDDEWYMDDHFVDAVHVQKIVVQDTVAPICTITDNLIDGLGETEASCEFTYEAVIDAADMCGIIDLQWELKNISKDPTELVRQGEATFDDLAEGTLPISISGLRTGSYKLIVEVRDDCQNESFCEKEFEVRAGKKPTPVCLTSIVVELNPMDTDQDGVFDTAMAVVWAEEYNSSSEPACEDSSIEFFMELRDGTGDDVLTDDDVDFLELGCDQVGMNLVRLYVRSASGTYDFCDVFLIVQDNNGVCIPDFSNVFGNIFTTDQLPVANVNVNGLSTSTDQSMTTGPDGLYSFEFNFDENVTITPERDGDDLQGVSAMDLILFSQNLFGTNPITDPYLRIAGDVDNNGELNLLDQLQMRALILGDVEEWEFVDSWRFVRESYEFTSMIPEAEDYQVVAFFIADQAAIQENFVAIKVGDLDLDRLTSRAPRSSESKVLEVEDLEFRAGEEIRVALHSVELLETIGSQMTLKFDPEVLTFLGDGDGIISEENFGVKRIDEGLVTVGWHENGQLVDLSSKPLLELRFEARHDGVLSEHLSIGNSPTQSEIYPALFEKFGLSFRFVPSDQKPGWRVEPAAPNPMTSMTSIEISIPESGQVDLYVFDAIGKMVYQQNENYDRGINTIQLDREHFGAPGLYYYQIRYKETSETNKLIVSP